MSNELRFPWAHVLLLTHFSHLYNLQLKRVFLKKARIGSRMWDQIWGKGKVILLQAGYLERILYSCSNWMIQTYNDFWKDSKAIYSLLGSLQAVAVISFVWAIFELTWTKITIVCIMLYNLQTLSHITHLIFTYSQKVGIFYFSFDKKEKQASDGLNDLPKVTHLVVQSLGFMPSFF